MSAAGSTRLQPLFLKLEGRTVLVVGAGPVGEGKIRSLLEAGAAVRVVAPDVTPEVRRLAAEGTLSLIQRPFEDRDAEGAWLIVAATSDAQTQRQAAAAAEARRVFLLAVDDPDHATAYSGAVLRRPPLVVAISSSGEAPALSRLLREIIEELLPSAQWVEHAKALRAAWARDRTPMGDRFGALVRAFKERAVTRDSDR
ncbi:MAG: precorrin-2 dehydrogenase/sirohydrochlorin ferrochelatase family protein [Polyangiaceae bacterium]